MVKLFLQVPLAYILVDNRHALLAEEARLLLLLDLPSRTVFLATPVNHTGPVVQAHLWKQARSGDFHPVWFAGRRELAAPRCPNGYLPWLVEVNEDEDWLWLAGSVDKEVPPDWIQVIKSASKKRRAKKR